MSLRFVFAGGAVCLTSLCIYATYLHQSLARQVEHERVSAKGRNASRASGETESVPKEVFEDSGSLRIIHESDAIFGHVSVPSADADAERLFTQLLRRNMCYFSKMPQSWIMRFMATSAEQKESFTETHIKKLEFHEGDIVCGFNRVVRRSPLKVELEFVVPANLGAFSGRLILSLQGQGSGAILKTVTMQWTEAAGSTTLPLERGPANFMHQMATWWLLVSGMKYLEGLSPVIADAREQHKNPGA